ncbi:MAG: hypothetical protein WEE89_05710 [Gemmatimonadota bacterium]
MADSGSASLNPDPTRLLVARILQGVIHDLNGVTANLLGLIQEAAYQRSFADAGAMKLFREEAVRVADLTTDLAALPMAITREPDAVAVRDLLQQAIRLLDHDPNYGDIRKTIACEPELPALYARRQALLEAFLLTGALACDAAGRHGEMTFACERHGDAIGIRIVHKTRSPLDWTDVVRDRVKILVGSEKGEARLGDYSSELRFSIPV